MHRSLMAELERGSSPHSRAGRSVVRGKQPEKSRLIGKILNGIILLMNGLKQLLFLALAFLLCLPGPLFAEYTLVLKNGRRITVQSYREEGGMIKFPGMGGEIGISREQIQSILKAGEPETRGMSLLGTERPSVVPPTTAREEKIEAGHAPVEEAKPGQAQEKALSPEEKLAEERAKEEKEYQNKVRQLTDQIKAARDRFSLATRGSTGPEPTLLQSEEAIRARTDDLATRLRDAGLVPGLRPGATIPGVEAPLPSYTGKEKDLSDLRNLISQFDKERERLIQEMRQKGFGTGSLFLE